MLLVAKLANTKWCEKPEKWLKPWHMVTHLRLADESFPMNTNTSGSGGFLFKCVFVLLTKLVSELEGWSKDFQLFNPHITYIDDRAGSATRAVVEIQCNLGGVLNAREWYEVHKCRAAWKRDNFWKAMTKKNIRTRGSQVDIFSLDIESAYHSVWSHNSNRKCHLSLHLI